jgi:hypothetical protein
VEGTGLIGATGYYHILAIPHQHTNELISTGVLDFNLDGSYSAATLQL